MYQNKIIDVKVILLANRIYEVNNFENKTKINRRPKAMTTTRRPIKHLNTLV